MLERLYNFDDLKSTELPCPAVVKGVGERGANETYGTRESRMERASR